MELGSRDAFDRMGTLGIEEEFFVVDETGRPTAGTDELVYESDPPEILDGRLDHELFKCVIETQTPTIGSLSAARDALADVREALVDHAEAEGFGIAAAGLHPAAKWRELEHAEKPRYRAQLDRIQYPQHRNTTAGLHVHVGVDDADKAVWVANEMRWYLPIMLALSANSPFWNGFDTGLSSARAKIFEGLPNTGMPTTFEDFEAFQSFERMMVENGSINDRGELWYDVRPHSEHGTVEVRTPDGQADHEWVLAFVEYTKALVEDLAARYEDGENGYQHRREPLDENKWRALRYGHDTELLSKDFSEAIPLGELVDRECSRLGVDGIREMYDAESGAERQRRLHESEGLDAVCEDLLLE
ncbi:glutamate--cysteine ligase [Natronomonas sp. CBA1123]|jgi:carboxylate-amine ligase|uniref:glutamate--cysteine ligase n=1 Tax=Natronomonas sp. CBA1123 TaxID=2668070 RepID=UPI0012EA059C|nr:glutamate--cysteine ligase [Natronomonas sp. CBA1123]MUV86397.1 glutamate--cysteine ligase [Natronomonas sp. CBA1123]